ncbi:hypothetical protein TNCV_1257801 [Trichonephila clavipes]|nr:hypothetical protein TNCV_1257801 [Trichonephila clavipes]
MVRLPIWKLSTPSRYPFFEAILSQSSGASSPQSDSPPPWSHNETLLCILWLKDIWHSGSETKQWTMTLKPHVHCLQSTKKPPGINHQTRYG